MVALLAAQAFLCVHTSSWRQAAREGYSFGLGYFIFGVGWVYISMHDFGAMPMPVAAFATVLFCAYLALFPAAACAVLGAQRWSAGIRLALLFPALWSLGEWLRGWFFTGFPWLAIGYSQVPGGPLGGIAPVAGVYGVSWLTALCATTISLLCLSQGTRRIPPAILLSILLAGGYAAGHINWTQPVGEPTSVTLVQGNIAQSIKWQPEAARETLQTYQRLTLASKSRLILLPETALPMFNVDIPSGYFQTLEDHGKAIGGDVLFGIPEYLGRARYYNSVMSLGVAPTQVYRKYHLVPFGDYFPRWPVLSAIMDALQIPMSDFSRGEPRQKPLDVGGQKVAVNICYEDVFGEEIIRQLPEATVLANFTNDAWWGDSKASEQHLQISQMRARETGRPMLRATNTGVSAMIDVKGKVIAALPQFTQATLETQVQGYAGTTPFSRWGNGAFLLLAGLLLSAGTFRRNSV